MKRAREGETEDDGGATPRAVNAAEEGEDEDATRAVYERVNAERAAIYGADARGEVSLKLECANNFKLSEAHELALWTLLPGEAKECVNPRWAFVRNKPLIDRVVIVLAPGLDHKRWCDEGATTCPRMKSVLRDGLKTMCESPTAVGMTLCKSLLYSVRGKRGFDGNGKQKKFKASTKAKDLCKRPFAYEPSKFVLTPGDMSDMVYPLPTLKEDGTLELEEGFVTTQPAGGGIARASGYYAYLALDCEFCYTAEGLQLTRVSIVKEDGEIVYDKLVKPPTEITNYNTEHSGITAEQMEGVETTLQDVQRELLEMIPCETILIGHSLENDLQRLKMIHANVVDTCALYPHKRGAPYRNALRFLTERYLGRRIQEGTHDSVADARATMELALLKFINGPSFGEVTTEGEGVFDVLSTHKVDCVMVDSPKLCRRLPAGSASIVEANSDAEVKAAVIEQIGKKNLVGKMAVFGHLHEYSEVLSAEAQRAHARETAPTDDEQVIAEKTRRQALGRLDAIVGEIWDGLPSNTLMLVTSGVGDAHTLRLTQEQKWKRHQKIGHWGAWTDEAEADIRRLYTRTKHGVTLAAVKQ
jgi:RNA exonuclease 1